MILRLPDPEKPYRKIHSVFNDVERDEWCSFSVCQTPGET